MVQNLPPIILRVVLDALGFVTETLQLPIPFMGLEARPYGSFLVSNVGTFGLDSAFAPVPPFVHVPVLIMVGAVTDKAVARDGSRWCGPCCRSASATTTASLTATRRRPWPGSSGSTWRIPRSSTRSPLPSGCPAAARPPGGWPPPGGHGRPRPRECREGAGSCRSVACSVNRFVNRTLRDRLRRGRRRRPKTTSRHKSAEASTVI